MEWALLLIPIIIPVMNTLINIFTWPTGKSSYSTNQKISVLIPARNEERNIRGCLEAVLNVHHPIHEIIVCDDRSSDRTLEILQGFVSHPKVQLIQAPPLPKNWIGKPHACHCLAQRATGDILLFIDSDVRLQPYSLHHIADLLRYTGFDGQKTDIVTAVPQQTLRSYAEHFLMPLLMLSYTAWLPMIFVRLFSHTSMLAANGQILAIRRNSYDKIGGFASIRQHIVDDMALCRQAKQNGARVLFADGRSIAHCRMYQSKSEIWQGFSKNIYRGIGGKFHNLIMLIGIYSMAFILPYLGLLLTPWIPQSFFYPCLTAVILNIALRSLLAFRYKHSMLSILLHPVAVAYLIFIALNSFMWQLKGQIFWRDRSYPSTEVL